MAARRGFTLIEILVVIGIIMFLAAFVIVAAVRFGNNSREQATKALIQRLGMGINKYYGTYRLYPAAPDVRSKNMSIYEFLIPHLENYQDSGGTWKSKMSPVCVEFNGGEVRRMGAKDWVVDAWGKKILYFATCDDASKPAAQRDNVAMQQAQIGQFTLISVGPNGVEGDADDISLHKVTY
jgi:prepilin-type N-terminal cleavage/methylation domain-containing protein